MLARDDVFSKIMEIVFLALSLFPEMLTIVHFKVSYLFVSDLKLTQILENQNKVCFHKVKEPLLFVN